MPIPDIVIVGIGGFAKEIAWLIDDLNATNPQWNLLGFVDPVESGKTEIYGRPVLGDYAATSARLNHPYFICGMGNPEFRLKESQHAEALGWSAATLVHPSVVCAQSVLIEEGTTIAAGSILGPNVQIGRHCVVNAQAFFGHDSTLGNFSVVSPGARINGHAFIGRNVNIGSNATVNPKCRIGDHATLGANSFLLTDLPQHCSAIGVPAKVFHCHA
jgi:sugar O-acyltransferase (sialic acid O-acetyltransferase NeuD family)